MAKRKLYSLNALALECGRNFRTLSRALENVKPDGRAEDGKPRWFLSTAISALAERERLTGRPSSRTPPERFDPKVEREIREIEVSGAEVDSLLAKLRAEPAVERRREMIEQGAGRCIGQHERALVATIGTGADAPLRRTYIDTMLQGVLADVASLCQWSLTELRE